MEHNWEDYFDTESEYWKKAQEIYEENDSYPKVVVKNRNLHHKFPRSFSKKDGVEIDNDKDNLVSLSLADHFLVHYYLWKCCTKKGYRRLMAGAFQFMRKRAIKYASDETIEALAIDYAAIMKDVSDFLSITGKGRHHSEETKKKISLGNKGKAHSEEWSKKTGLAHKGKEPWNKGKHHSEETCRKIAATKKGQVPWSKGKTWSNPKDKGNHNNKGENNPMYGRHQSEEAKKKMSEANKGKHWYNNGKINVYAYDCPQGFAKGRL